MDEQQKAIVVGVGADPGLGAALCRRVAREGMHVFIAARTAERIEPLAASIRAGAAQATAIPTDTTDEGQVLRLFDAVETVGGNTADLVIYNAGNNRIASLREMEVEFFTDVWRVACLGGFLVGREAARRMTPRGAGTLIFTGATASIRGRPPFAAFASAKAGLRALAQALAREFGPLGIHVAHVVIDGVINGEQIRSRFPEYAERLGPDGMLDIDAICDTYWWLYRQQRTAWSHEVDLRPYKEPF
jgi:NAD(P)-dependent dehydrogenase (short-subunit alcohol dehydrogenase family)